MGRPKRVADSGLIYHVLNRANARMTIFEKDEDYEALERVLHEAVERTATRLVAYCVMPNHRHLMVWPQADRELSRFTGWLTLTLTHTQRWHAHRQSTGGGRVYPARFKSFPEQDDDHFYTMCRYVERNALRASLAERAEDWRWGSLFDCRHLLTFGVFRELADIRFFRRARVAHGTVVWPHEQDICPDALYEDSTKVAWLNAE